MRFSRGTNYSVKCKAHILFIQQEDLQDTMLKMTQYCYTKRILASIT